MVMFSLLVIGAWMILLGWIEKEGRLVLFGFGTFLILAGGGVQAAIRKLIQKTSHLQ
jgi:hypothetical protein